MSGETNELFIQLVTELDLMRKEQGSLDFFFLVSR
jgi:hypothetical protein